MQTQNTEHTTTYPKTQHKAIFTLPHHANRMKSITIAATMMP